MLPASGNILNAVALLFQLVPKNLISLAVGWLARLKLPGPIGRIFVSLFAKAFSLNLAEAEYPIDQYPTIEDLFTRRLKTGARPLHGPLISPADGYLAVSASCEHPGMAVQAKGLSYSLKQLVGLSNNASPTFAWYQTVYLAPHNYHRVHSPFAGRVRRLRYIPGQLWPVNVPFVLRIPRLFCRNERLVFEYDLATGGKAWVVMVGALNVGRMVTPLKPELVTNGLARQMNPSETEVSVDQDLALGAEIGTFMLGSTVILVYDADGLSGLGGPEVMIRANDNNPVKMGQSLLRGGHD